MNAPFSLSKNPVRNRRTFAIISHPDAGKTTLTEKLLLFGGAIHAAGEVRARGQNRRARLELGADLAARRAFAHHAGVGTGAQHQLHQQPCQNLQLHLLEGGFEIGLKAHRRVAVTGVLSANQVLRKLKLHERLTIHLGVGIKPAPGSGPWPKRNK